jgi:TetR/AcrR family transcriptional regulator, transcriptional repressor for nem operon
VGQRLRRGHGRPDLGPGLCLRALVGEIAVNADDALRADIASGYDTWRTIFQSGLSTMKARGELRDGADPRHLAAAPIIAHQGSAGLSQLVGSSAPLRATLAAAVAYVGSFVADQSRSASLRTRLKTACHRGGTTPAQVLPSLRVVDRSDATV